MTRFTSRIIKSSLVVLVAVTLGGMLFVQRASAETDTTRPTLGKAGTSTIKVDWGFAQGWSFKSVYVKDTAADGYCVTPFMNVNRRASPDTGWIYLNGAKPGSLWYSTPYAVTCGKGKSYNDPYGTSPFGSPRPWLDLAGARGVSVRLCQTDSSGKITGSCGAPVYAANNGR